MISNAEIEELADGLMRKYLAAKKRVCTQIDIEDFCTHFLNLQIAYANFAEDDMDKIGFLSDGITPLRIHDDSGKVMKALYPARTIVIEKHLLNPSEVTRRRFTIAHEGSHHIFNLHCLQPVGACFNTVYDKEANYTLEQFKQRFSLPESQTDRMAACLLMPRFLVIERLKRENNDSKIKVYGESIIHRCDKALMQKLADSFGASYSAFFIRLRELKLFQECDIDEYIERELMPGGESFV